MTLYPCSLIIDLTLTTERLVELFAPMKDGIVADRIGFYLGTPSSKSKEFQRNYRNPAQRKEAYLDYYVHNHPAASWMKIAKTLRRCELPQQAAMVENTYIQGIDIQYYTKLVDTWEMYNMDSILCLFLPTML